MKAVIPTSGGQNLKIKPLSLQNQVIEITPIETMSTSIPTVSKQNVKVNNIGGSLTPFAPITLKNQIIEITSIENIPDVSEVNVIDGATLVYNSSNDKYEIKPLSFGDLDANIDGGLF